MPKSWAKNSTGVPNRASHASRSQSIVVFSLHRPLQQQMAIGDPMKKLSALAAALTIAGGMVVAAQSNSVPERFTAMAVNMERGGSGTIEIVVDRWSSDADRKQLLTTLSEKGPDKLLDIIQKLPRVGYFRLNGGLGYDLHYAHHEKGEDGGERVVLATDRRIGFWEAANQPRSIDYPFTIVEMHLNNDGEGEGKLSLATKVTMDNAKSAITLENYATQPVLLQSVKRER